MLRAMTLLNTCWFAVAAMPVPLPSTRLNWIVPLNAETPATLPVISLASAREAPPMMPEPDTPTWLFSISWFWIVAPFSATPVVLPAIVFRPEPGANPTPPELLSTVLTRPVTLPVIVLPSSAAAAA